MTQVSRPFQVGLAAVAVLAAVWLVALRGHSGSSGSGSAPAAAQQQAPQSSNPSPASSAPYTGSAPGIAGLTRAVERARGAVALSERNAHQLQQQSDQASSSSAAAATPTGTSSAQRASATRSASKPAAAHSPATKTPAPAAPHPGSALPVSRATLSAQALVEAQLRAGKVVAILFWKPRAEVDQLVRSELLAAQRALHGQLAVDSALASQAGAFGTFTRAVQVLQTPTILLVNRRGQTSSLTGLADTFSLQQAIREARG
jgi:hypothetical protein